MQAALAECGANIMQELDNYAQTAWLKLKAQKAVIYYSTAMAHRFRLIMFVLHFIWQAHKPSSSDFSTQITAVQSQYFKVTWTDT